MIRIGPAGIPLSCKGRTNKDGIVYTKKILDLNAMEVQFVRGLYVMKDEEADFLKEYAANYDIELHVHAPYYINLASSEEAEFSIEKIMFAANLGKKMGAENIIIHPGYYGERSKTETKKQVVKNIGKLNKLFKEEEIDSKIAIETMGKQEVFGSLEEIIDVCKKTKNTVPVLNIGHIHARGDGWIKERKDYEKIFEKVKPLKLDHYLIHITGVIYHKGNELHHLPLKKSDLDIKPLIDIILDNNYNVTLISESPLREHDAVSIRLKVEKALAKRSNLDQIDFRDLSQIV
ncbi:MAG: TIM barrel protein [Candidatus Thermoplasmatota archaeon]